MSHASVITDAFTRSCVVLFIADGIVGFLLERVEHSISRTAHQRRELWDDRGIGCVRVMLFFLCDNARPPTRRRLPDERHCVYDERLMMPARAQHNTPASTDEPKCVLPRVPYDGKYVQNVPNTTVDLNSSSRLYHQGAACLPACRPNFLSIKNKCKRSDSLLMYIDQKICAT